MLSPQVLQSYRELFGIAPERHYTDAQCDEYVEQYVHMMNSRTHFTENVAFNIVYDGRMKLVVCVSTPASTGILNDQMRIAVTWVHPLTRKDWKRQCTLPSRWCSRDVGEFASSSVAQGWTYISCVFAVLDCVMAIFYRKYSCIGAVVMHCRIVQPMQH